VPQDSPRRTASRLSNHLWPEISAQLMSATPTAHFLEYANWWNPVLAEPQNAFATRRQQSGSIPDWAFFYLALILFSGAISSRVSVSSCSGPCTPSAATPPGLLYVSDACKTCKTTKPRISREFMMGTSYRISDSAFRSANRASASLGCDIRVSVEDRSKSRC
jgi:hypothetical protein